MSVSTATFALDKSWSLALKSDPQRENVSIDFEQYTGAFQIDFFIKDQKLLPRSDVLLDADYDSALFNWHKGTQRPNISKYARSVSDGLL